MSVLELIPKIKLKKAKAPKGPAMAPVSVPRYTPPSIPSQHPVPSRLSKKLAGLRQKLCVVRVSERLAQCLAAALILLTVQMFIDWLVILPFLVRLVILCGDIALLVFFVRKHILPFFLNPPNQEACALLVEKHWPRFRGRVIASVQFSRPSQMVDSSALVSALQRETEAGTGTLDFGEVVPVRPLVRRAGMALSVTILWICLFIVTLPGSAALLERVILIPALVPRKTQVICLSKDKIIPAGESVLLEAQATGIIPSHGRITLTYDSGRIQEITLDPERDKPDHFSLNIEKVEESLRYVITLNDGTSDRYSVKTIPRPDITSIDCMQTYPAYTGLAPVKRTVGNLALLAGSKLAIHALANCKITKASLKLTGLDQIRPLTVGGSNGNDLTGQIDIPATGLTGFSIEITNESGITSGDETLYRIDLIPDRPPSIAVTIPEALQMLCTIKAKPNIAFVASDDYGLAKVSLCYRVVQQTDDAAPVDASGNPVPPPEPTRIDMDLNHSHPLNLKAQYSFDLSAIQPAVMQGSSVEYWMEARDANDVTQPGITESEHRVIKVVSELEKKDEMMNKLLSDLTTLKDTEKVQTQINKDLSTAIQGTNAVAQPAPPPATPSNK